MAAAAILLAGAPAVSLGQSELEARLERVERLLDGGALVRMLQDLETLRGEVQALRGEVEVQSNTLSQLRARQRELYLGLDQRMLRIEATGPGSSEMLAATDPAGLPPADQAPAPPLPAGVDSSETLAAPSPSEGSTGAGTDPIAAVVDTLLPSESAADADTPEDPPDPESLTPAAADPIREQQDYEAAFNLLKGGRYDDAARAFRSFLAAWPGGEFEDNARYWLGETYYVTRQFEAARQEFQGVIRLFPQSSKLTHAMLKIGYIHHELGRIEEAKQALLQLVESHPDSTAAGLARKRLKRLPPE